MDTKTDNLEFLRKIVAEQVAEAVKAALATQATQATQAAQPAEQLAQESVWTTLKKRVQVNPSKDGKTVSVIVEVGKPLAVARKTGNGYVAKADTTFTVGKASYALHIALMQVNDPV